MKKFLTIVFLTQFLTTYNFPAFSKPYEPQVKGGFKSCTAIEYRTKSGKFVNKSGVKSYTMIFDEKGNQIELTSYENNKVVQKNKIENKYNDNGLLIETVYLDESGKPIIKFTFEYDDKMNKIADATINNIGMVTARGTYIYDENDFLIQEIHEFTYDNNTTKGITNYKNDKYGNKIEETAVHSLNASAQVSAEYNLDNNENKTDATTTETNSEPDKITYEYKYDDRGNIIRDVRYGIGGTKLIHEYKYDKFGNIIEQISFDENNKPALKTVFEYTN